MQLKSAITWAAALVGTVSADGAAIVRDPETGFTFSEFGVQYQLNGSPMIFRTAQASGLSPGSDWDIVLQIVCPINVGWAGLSWGGSMTNAPLSVAWPGNGNAMVLSSRYATARVKPNPYNGATYQTLRVGTGRNSTHWRIAVKCSGCTQFGTKSLNPNGSTRLAWAFGKGKPTNPSSNTSDFPYHDSHNYFQHDFASGANPQFSELLQKNS